jgi:predicted ribosome quality control (RQC) complex YloA/Tae2 family protein
MTAMTALYAGLLVREIKGAVVGRRLDRVDAPEPDVVVLALRGAERSLVLDAGRVAPRIGWEERPRGRARAAAAEPGGALAAIADALLGGRAVANLAQPDGDRWVHVDFGDGKGIVWECLGRRANVVLVENGMVVACLRSYAAGAPGVTRAIAVGAPYPPPPARGPADAGGASGAAADAGAAGNADASAGGDAALRRVAPCVIHVEGAAAAPRLSAFEPGADEDAGAAAARAERHATLADAAAAWGAAMRAWDARARLLAALRTNSRNAARRARRALTAVERDLARADQSGAQRHAGEALVASFHMLRRGALEARVPDPRDAGTTLIIPLDPTKTPQENADRYFKDAKRGERGRAFLVARREALARTLARAEADMARWDGAAGEGAALADLVAAARAAGLAAAEEIARAAGRGAPREPARAGGAHDADAAPALARTTRDAPRPTRDPYLGARLLRYEVAGGFTVLVGRTDADNDILTHKIARPWDLWFHSGQSAGSHVVLVKGSAKSAPPKEALLEAATLAAYHSKARNAGLVPVIFTERRYVRRPRRAPAGLVACEREKTLFVRPDALEAKRAPREP